MKAEVTAEFMGAADHDPKTRKFVVGEIVSGDLASVAVAEGWAVSVNRAEGVDGQAAQVDGAEEAEAQGGQVDGAAEVEAQAERTAAKAKPESE
ncbi:hypothetical protein H2509_20365 [Stappia sp. F7233]|uniref:Uncharacterized protein n=1 Tax=Stappia albiluteola TaxID=2758565 RepID=A0A839AID1_9HYPH|nr:hypothetical protein [Stappia albiluteola]MBA5779491.1 hypothetical protein [Stappia albiluteola]